MSELIFLSAVPLCHTRTQGLRCPAPSTRVNDLRCSTEQYLNQSYKALELRVCEDAHIGSHQTCLRGLCDLPPTCTPTTAIIKKARCKSKPTSHSAPTVGAKSNAMYNSHRRNQIHIAKRYLLCLLACHEAEECPLHWYYGC